MARRRRNRSPHIKTPASAQRWIISAGEDLDDSIRAQILALGDRVVSALIELLGTEYHEEDDPGEGYAPIHAARILRELGAESAIPALLNAFAWLEIDDHLFSEIELALRNLGSAVAEPILTRLEGDLSDDQRVRLLSVVARAGVQDDRIPPLLAEFLSDHPMFLAGAAAHYGDPSLLPHLSAALDRCSLPPPDPDTFFASFAERQCIVELTSAIEDLGGELTSSQKARSEIVFLQIEAWRQKMSLPEFDLSSLLGN